MYKIRSYSKQKAKELDVIIKPSAKPKKKIDVYKDDKKVASVGAIGFKDYPTYVTEKGKQYADERRRLYKIRHSKDNGLNGYYAKNLLW